jgi:hypothetical protein
MNLGKRKFAILAQERNYLKKSQELGILILQEGGNTAKQRFFLLK